MTDNTLSEALKEAYASTPSNITILHTLELRHPAPAFKDEKGNSTAIRVVRDNVNHICKLEDNAPLDGGKEVEFVALAFDLELPPVENIPVPEISLSLDNVSTEIMRYLDQAIETQDMIEMTANHFGNNGNNRRYIKNISHRSNDGYWQQIFSGRKLYR